MKNEEKTLYAPPFLETTELRNEQGFATSGDTSSFGDENGTWDL